MGGQRNRRIIRFGRKQAKAISSKLFGHTGGIFVNPRNAKAPKPCVDQECSNPPGARKKLQVKKSCTLHQGKKGDRHSDEPWTTSYPCSPSTAF